MTHALPMRIFLATPSDLSDERQLIAGCVAEHNAQHAASGPTYEVVGWDRIRGTARRPQDEINELIDECHFMIVLFKRSWGSSPGSPWGYTSGTEEELFTGLLALGQAEHPMRDVWLGFVDDPSPDEKVIKLRQAIADSHALLFETITNPRDLKNKALARLSTWDAMLGAKVPRMIDLLPSSGRDVLRAANLRIKGETLLELGQQEAGREALAKASSIGGPREHLTYARYLRRQGRLDEAHAEIQKAIDRLVEYNALYSTETAQAVEAQAQVLSAQGNYIGAIGRLEHALGLLRQTDDHSQLIRSRLHDDIGRARMKLEEYSSARLHFATALRLREHLENPSDIAQSLINLARLEVAEKNLGQAAQYSDQALERLRLLPPSNLRANSEVLAAQVKLRQGRPRDAQAHALWGLEINRQIANKTGEAISLLVLAQCLRATGKFAEARQYAQECLKINQDIGNTHGIEKAQWLLQHMEN